MEALAAIIEFASEDIGNAIVVAGFLGAFGFFAPPLKLKPQRRTQKKAKKEKKDKPAKARQISKKGSKKQAAQRGKAAVLSPNTQHGKNGHGHESDELARYFTEREIYWRRKQPARGF